MKKLVLTLFNIIVSLYLCFNICSIFSNFPNNDFFSTVNSPTYEKTDEYNSLFNKKLSDLFTYINLKCAFETNNKFNKNKVIASSTDEIGRIKHWTLEECMITASYHGYYIDNNFRLNKISSVNPTPFDNTYTINFVYKSYPSNRKIGTSNEEEFIIEVINSLTEYYRLISDFDENTSNFLYNISFFDDISTEIFTNSKAETFNYENSLSYVYISSEDNIIKSNAKKLNGNIMEIVKTRNPFPEKDFVIKTFVDNNYPKNDIFKTSADAYNSKKIMCANLFTSSMISAFLFIFSTFFLLFLILTTKKKIEKSTTIFINIPSEIYFLLYLIILTSLTFLSKNYIPMTLFSVSDNTKITLCLSSFSFYISTIILLTILSEKYANNTIIPITLKNIKKNLKSESNILPKRFLAIFIYVPIIFFIIIAIYIIFLYTTLNIKLLLIVGIMLLLSTILFVFYIFFLYSTFNEAFKVQISANKMKTSLIESVSHDIKTPLTTIINYSDLINLEMHKHKKTLNEKLLHYAKVINEKSIRLNDLINDLIFDSKVSTGNLNISLKKIDLTEIIPEILEEFNDRLNERKLKIVYTVSDKKIIINSDERQLYRIFQNLFSNIYKYALENSRIYFDISVDGNKVIIRLKNIQKDKLEVNVNSLTEKFVRGNKSRTIEGFGLGLSITDNLVRALSGKLEIQNFEDEFIVIITFIKYG